MQKDTNQNLIDEILNLSQESNPELQKRIQKLIKIYTQQAKQHEKWDKRNKLSHEQDLKKDKLIEQQSRLAAMGEMIDAVAHQWRQPLNAISMVMEMLKDEFQKGNLTNSYMDEAQGTIEMQIEHMITTLNEFRSFLRPSTRNENFYIYETLENIQILMKDELISQNVNLTVDIDKKIQIYGNNNELKHLFINLINNSIDAFNDREIEKRNIYIRCYEQKNKIYIEVEDNAGGVQKEVINTLFDANITTKQKGSGIGLYMSAQIVKKNNGTITVHNSNKGAFFTIVLQQPII